MLIIGCKIGRKHQHQTHNGGVWVKIILKPFGLQMSSRNTNLSHSFHVLPPVVFSTGIFESNPFTLGVPVVVSNLRCPVCNC